MATLQTARAQPVRDVGMGYLHVGLATAIVGSIVVVSKVAVADLPPVLASALRLTLAAPVMLGIVVLQERGVPRVPPRDWLWPFLEALSGVCLGSVFMLAGVQYTSAADAGIILATTPAVAAVLAVILLRERLGGSGWCGVALAVAGILVLTVQQEAASAHAPNRLLGNLLVLCAVAAESVSVIVGKRATDVLPARHVSLLVIAFAWMLLAPWALFTSRAVEFSGVGTNVWAAVAYYGLVGSVCGNLLWFRGLSRIPASTAGVFMGVPPVSALVLSALVLGETIRAAHLSGVICVLGALVCMHRDGLRRAVEGQSPVSAAR